MYIMFISSAGSIIGAIAIITIVIIVIVLVSVCLSGRSDKRGRSGSTEGKTV